MKKTYLIPAVSVDEPQMAQDAMIIITSPANDDPAMVPEEDIDADWSIWESE